MFNVTRKVSFSVAIALTVGWGIFFLLFLTSSNTLLEAQQIDGERAVPLPPGVRLNVQVDKRIYRGGDTILIAVRNDSRIPVWIKTAEDCPSAWWAIERLDDDGETWRAVSLTKKPCAMNGIIKFTNHTLNTDVWMAFVPGPQVGEVLINPPTGTYRVVMPYIKGKVVTIDNWTPQTLSKAFSTAFTIQ